MSLLVFSSCQQALFFHYGELEIEVGLARGGRRRPYSDADIIKGEVKPNRKIMQMQFRLGYWIYENTCDGNLVY